ncbi:MAG: protoporphyrinogen/coproporphyrinogen oxidase [Actinomycetota bacterium]
MSAANVQPQAKNSSQSADLVVLGSGITALAAAARAATHGYSVIVLDDAAAIGGLAASLLVGDIRVDIGSRRLQTAVDDDILADLRQLLGTDLQRRVRTSRVRVAGRWVGFPLRPQEVMTKLPRRLAAKATRDAFLTMTRRGQRHSYEEVLRFGFGPSVYEAVYGPYAHKVWGVAGDQLDADHAHQRMSVTHAWQLVGRAGRGAEFWYPRRGFGQIVEAFAERITSAGGVIKTRAGVTEIQARPDSVRIINAGHEVQAGQLFSALPARTLGQIARPAPSAQAVGHAAGLTFRAVVMVYLIHDGGRWTPYDTHYLPSANTAVSRLSEPTNYRVNPDDPTDRSVICAEIPCWVGDPVWTAGPAELTELVKAGIQRSGLPDIRVAGVDVHRHPAVYPVYTRGYAERLADILDWSDRLTRVTMIGRLGLFTHDNTHRELRAAYDVADCLRPEPGGASFDHQAWVQARNRHTQTLMPE